MGIKDLWTILSPFCERKPLYELQGKKVAIDLSCWVCEAQNITEYQVQPKMYLRNLYFRTCYLLLLDVTPVFVLEGKAPELKYKTIAARNALQFKGAAPRNKGEDGQEKVVKAGKDRSRFNHTLKLCEEMLNLLGIVCVKGLGEAEAYCAYLNEDNLVDGIISQDSDCFAYGARIVYRNFSISQQGHHAASGGSVDVYDLDKVKNNIDFGRNKIIALALLCGSDYSEGVHGVGKDSVVKLFQQISDGETLKRLRDWRSKNDFFCKLEDKITNKNLCTSCGHLGKVQSHKLKGCSICRTQTGCDDSEFKEERLRIKNEMAMRKRALADPDFPDETLVREFLVRKDKNISHLDLRWKKPEMTKFIIFTSKYLMWEEIYCFEKFLPILTRWQLLNHDLISKNCITKGLLIPDKIKKKRNPKGVSSFEIIWQQNRDFSILIPEEQLTSCKSVEKLWSTIEPLNLVEIAYPDLVQAFIESKTKKPKKATAAKKRGKIQEIDELMHNISISTESKKPKRATKRAPPKQKKLDDFSFIQNCCSTPIANKKLEAVKQVDLKTFDGSFDPDLSNFGDEDDLEVSDIVERIIGHKITVPREVMDGIKIDDADEDLLLKPPDNVLLGDQNCSFFMSTNELSALDGDLFEKTFSEVCGNNFGTSSSASSDDEEI